MTSPRERAQLTTQLRQQQEALVRDLLPVLDALERAETHWRRIPETTAATRAERQPDSWPWRWLRRWLAGPAAPAAADGTGALARGAGEGIRLIRGDLVEALRRHGLEPINSLGMRFDPERMRALGQRPGAPGTEPGTVVEEAVRGYLWRQTLLREAQVLVAGP